MLKKHQANDSSNYISSDIKYEYELSINIQ